MSTASTVQTLKKLNLYKQNPDLFKDLSNAELAELVMSVMGVVQVINKAIEEKRLDGYTPQPDKDYVSKDTMEKLFDTFAEKLQKENQSQTSEVLKALETKIQAKLDSIKDGEDGTVTDEEIERAAELALALLELPDFDALVEERITANPMAVRDSLETIVKEKEKLEQSAIKNLPEDLRQLQEQIARLGVTIRGGGVGTSKHVVDTVITERIADGTISGGSVSVETPSGTANGSNTDFTVSNEPKYVVVNTLTYFAGGGYEYAGGTITFDIPPASGSVIRSIY